MAHHITDAVVSDIAKNNAAKPHLPFISHFPLPQWFCFSNQNIPECKSSNTATQHPSAWLVYQISADY